MTLLHGAPQGCRAHAAPGDGQHDDVPGHERVQERRRVASHRAHVSRHGMVWSPVGSLHAYHIAAFFYAPLTAKRGEEHSGLNIHACIVHVTSLPFVSLFTLHHCNCNGAGLSPPPTPRMRLP